MAGVIVGLTNDDGIDAPGLSVLADAVSQRGHTPVVVAPLVERSGSGTGLGRVGGGDAFVVDRRVEHGAVRVALDSTPAMCVLAALRGVAGAVPEVVVSGINHGPNLGLAVLHSGTVGAALTAFAAGVPAVAVSFGEPASGLHPEPSHLADRPETWAATAELAVDLVERAARVRPPAVLNVNVPSTWDRVVGVRWARLAEIGAIELSTGDDSVTVRLVGASDLVRTEADDDWPVDLDLNRDGVPTITPVAALTARSLPARTRRSLGVR